MYAFILKHILTLLKKSYSLFFKNVGWHLAMKDPETIVSKCEEKYRELQTSVWVDFMVSQQFIATRSILKKENANNQTFNGNDQIETKNLKNLLSEKTSTNAHNSTRHEDNRVGSQIVPIGNEFQWDRLSTCESGSPFGIGSTTIGLQKHEKNDNEKQIGSSYGSSCNDSSLSNSCQTKRWDWIVTMNTSTCERAPEKLYMFEIN